MKVYSELERASLENLSTAPANPVDGLAYYDTTLKRVRVYRDGSWGDQVDATATITMTNKSIDADNNTISNLETDNLKVGVIEVDLAGTISTSNDTIPSAKAVKNYVNSVSAVNDTFATTILAAHATIRSSIHGVATVAGTEDVDASTTICKSYADTILASHATIRSSIHGVATVAGTADVDAATTVCKTYTDTVVSSHATVSTGVHGVTGSVVGTTDAQSISAKTISSSKFTDHVGLAVTTLGATPAAGFINLYAKGTSLFTKTEAGTETEVGSGAGGSSDNLVTNADAKTDTTGYIAYKDAAGTSPVDGAGGTPTLAISRTTTAGEILSGTASFKITKAAGDEQGEGISYDITVDEAHRGQPLQLSFDMEVLSGTYADGDMKMYVFDVTNTIMMECVPTTIGLAIAGQSRKVLAGFQPQYNCETARIIWHVASTSTIAYTLAMDNVKVWEPAKSTGVISTDPVSFTPTFNGLGTPTGVLTYWERVGNKLKCYGSFTTGTVTASEAKFYLPNGFVIGGAFSTNDICGSYGRDQSSVYHGGMILATSGHNYVGFGDAAFSALNTNCFTRLNGNTAFGTGLRVPFVFEVPILGWSSNMVLSSDAGNRQLVATMKPTSVATGQSGYTKVLLGTIVENSAGMADTANNRINIIEGGYYLISGAAYLYAAAANDKRAYSYIKVNGTLIDPQAVVHHYGTTTDSCVPICVVKKLNAGDYVELWGQIVSTTFSIYEKSYLSVAKLATPQTIAQTEFVGAKYVASDEGSLSSTHSIVKYQTKVYDTHGIYDVATGVITFPYAGYYKIIASGYPGGVNPTSNNQIFEIAIANSISANTAIAEASNRFSAGNGYSFGSVALESTVKVFAGDQKTIQARTGVPSANFGNSGTTGVTFLVIERVG